MVVNAHVLCRNVTDPMFAEAKIRGRSTGRTDDDRFVTSRATPPPLYVKIRKN